MKKINTPSVLVMLSLVLLPASAYALYVKGVEIPEQIIQEASQQPLVLNGVGVRAKFVFDIYVGALYLTSRSSESEQILADTSPRRISMHFLYKEIEKAKMIKAWNQGFNDNLDPAQRAALEAEIEAFNAAFGDTMEGDVVIIDFLPDTTTLVSINLTEKARISGADFQRALLSVWLGESPVDSGLKKAMLGQE